MLAECHLNIETLTVVDDTVSFILTYRSCIYYQSSFSSERKVLVNLVNSVLGVILISC